MIFIYFLRDHVQFTFTGSSKKEDKEDLAFALNKMGIHYSNILGDTPSDCDLYAHVTEFESANQICELFGMEYAPSRKVESSRFFKEPLMDYKFMSYGPDLSYDLISKRIEQLKNPKGLD